MLLSNKNTSGQIELVQKKSAQNTTSLVQKKLNAIKQTNVSKTANKTKKKYASAPIQEIADDDQNMETEQEIVESVEQVQKDFQAAAEIQEKEA